METHGQLEGKVCLITGAGQGIGRGLALRFAREGAAVGVMDVQAAACRSVAAEITAAGGRAMPLPGSVASKTPAAAASPKGTSLNHSGLSFGRSPTP